MYSVYGRNVNDVFLQVVDKLRIHGEQEQTRNGRVLSLLQPLCVQYTHPEEHVLFANGRNENPFLHLFDGIFSLQGKNRAEFMFQFQDRFREYSDDGQTFHGHYGLRLNAHYDYDFDGSQLDWAIQTLRHDPSSRRVVLQLFDPSVDHTPSKDIPCNVSIALRITRRCLDITVFNRSNDILWGLLGANVVQFSMLLRLLAAAIGVPVGRYYHITNNAHGYLDFGPMAKSREIATRDRYFLDKVQFYPNFCLDYQNWIAEAGSLVWGQTEGFREPFFIHVAAPALDAWKNKSIDAIKYVLAQDWREAMFTYAVRNGWK